MASILRQIVAGPRARHPEARLDLCYVTDNIIVTSGPSSVWPKKAYRNPTDQLVSFLDKKHGEDWAIFEFRAEGTGYPDSEVYNRIHHFPWPDHHPPPFAIIPNLMASMRNWIQGGTETTDTADGKSKRVAVVHCKAGKGRSGTSACSYLISEEGWKREDALHRFTIRRMRAGFGNGVSIPSQLRWVRYVDRWTNDMSKKYVERPVEISEVHIKGLREGVKVCIEGFVDEGRRIKVLHTFSREEKIVVDGPQDAEKTSTSYGRNHSEVLSSPIDASPFSSSQEVDQTSKTSPQDVILRPVAPVQLPTSDMNIDFERRNNVKYTGYTMVTSIAHVWFNAWFEGGFEGADSGVFEIDWEAMDGIKGSARKGTQAFEHLKVVWKYSETALSQNITEPGIGEPVKEGKPVDWTGDEQKEDEAKHSDGLDSGRPGASALTMGAMINQGAASLSRELGLRKSLPESADISRAASEVDHNESAPDDPIRKSTELKKLEEDERAGVKPHGPGDEDYANYDETLEAEGVDGRADTSIGHGMETGLGKAAHVIASLKGTNGDKHD